MKLHERDYAMAVYREILKWLIWEDGHGADDDATFDLAYAMTNVALERVGRPTMSAPAMRRTLADA